MFTVVGECVVDLAPQTVAYYDVTNICGEVVARTCNASPRNRALAVARAAERNGGVIALDADRIEVHAEGESLYDEVARARRLGNEWANAEIERIAEVTR